MKYSARDQRPKTAVIYTRVSTDEQAEHGFSLAHQEDLLRRECARKGIQIVEHFKDDGYSAKDFKRPDFQRLLDYLKRHKKQIQYLFVTKWCRFSRDVANTILMNRELQSYGTRVVTLDDGEESDNPASFLLTMLNMTLPKIDNRIRSRNTRAGILRALKEGFYPYGGSPKGYTKDRSSQKTPLLIRNELAPLVREAFEVFGTGAFPIEDVRKASWKNGLKLQRSQFGQILRNPVYMGKICVPETETEETRLVNGVHEAIVPENLFLKVQKILNKRMETNTHLCAKEKLRDELPLRGHLKCPQCGKNWTGSISSGNGGKYPYYHCEKGCKARASAAIAHEQLFQYLNTLQPPPEIIDLQFVLTLLPHHLFDKQDIQWLRSFKEHNLTDEEARTLIVIREKDSISNAEYRTINVVDTLAASGHLRRLRDLGLLEQKGRGNTTFYIPTIRLLAPNIEPEAPYISSLSEGFPSLSEELNSEIQKFGKRTPPEAVKQIIKQLCALRPIRPSDLAVLLKRNQRYVRDYYLTPMVESGDLELAFPENPAHPQQAYRATK